MDGRTVTAEPLSPDDIENEFPAWEVWRGTDNLWHARVRNAEPPVMVADDHLDGLRDEIIHKISQLEAAEYLRRGAS
jgi:hypothetical protein